MTDSRPPMVAVPLPPDVDDRKEFTLPGLLLGATLTVGAFAALAAGLGAVTTSSRGLPDYPTWLASVPREWTARLQWVLGDVTEPQFYKSWIASIGLFVGATFAWLALRSKKSWAGEPIAYGSGLWPWMLGAASLSLILSNIIFGSKLEGGWQPTFVPFVCVATAVVLIYGAGWDKLLTGAILGVFTTPLAMALITYVSAPLGLPAVVANTISMSIGATAVFLLCRLLPWMKLPVAAPESQEETVAAKKRTPSTLSDAVWMIRRIITDFTETQFYANEWASIGLIIGAAITTLVNPDFASYGSGLLPKIMLAQSLTSALGILVWRDLYRGGGWAPTYVSVVSVAPATVLAYGGGTLALILGAVGGALLCPIVARTISNRLPSDFHPFVGNTISMALVTAIIVPSVGLIVS